jgi:hypothetical protein
MGAGNKISKLCKDFKLKSNCISNCCSNGASQEVVLHDISPKEHKHKTKHHKKDKKDKIHITDKEVQTDIKQEPEEAQDIVG